MYMKYKQWRELVKMGWYYGVSCGELPPIFPNDTSLAAQSKKGEEFANH